MRLLVARCEVRYSGRLSAVLPEAVRLLINDPLGIRMLLAAAVLQIVGTLIVRKLADIQY